MGSGPESDALAALRDQPCVTVENRWVAEEEIAGVIAWADLLVLPYREASQSGAAAVAVAAGRWVVATRVGGLMEQLAGEPTAVACDPDAGSLAAALRDLIETKPPAPPPGAGAGSAWTDLAAALVRCAGTIGQGRN